MSVTALNTVLSVANAPAIKEATRVRTETSRADVDAAPEQLVPQSGPRPEPSVDKWEQRAAETPQELTYVPETPRRQVEARYSVDEGSHQTVVEIHDSATGEVLQEVPAEAIRRLAESLMQAAAGEVMDFTA